MRISTLANRANRTILFLIALMIFTVVSAQAGNIYWDGSVSTDWGTALNWDTGAVPGSADKAYVNDITSNIPEYDAGEGVKTIDQLNVGSTGSVTGALDLTGGALHVTSGGWVSCSGTGAATGTVNISGGLLDYDVFYGIGNGFAGVTGVVNVSGGVLNADIGYSGYPGSVIRIGASSGTGTVNISGTGQVTFGVKPEFDYSSGVGVVNFLAGTTGSWTVAGVDKAYFQGLYTGNDLTYQGTNTSSFDDVFVVDGSTIRLGTTFYWDGSESTDWGTKENWDTNMVPGSADKVKVNLITSNTPEYDAGEGEKTIKLLSVGTGTGTTGKLDFTGGILHVTDGGWWGQSSGNGTVDISGGLLDFDVFYGIGNAAGSIGVVNVSGGVFNADTGYSGYPDSAIRIGASSGTGTVNISGTGQVTFGVKPEFDYNSGVGVVNFLAGTTGSWTVAGVDKTYFQGLYAGGDLTYKGTNISPFDDVFMVAGSTIQLIPEPGTFVLALTGVLPVLPLWRRWRKRHGR